MAVPAVPTDTIRAADRLEQLQLTYRQTERYIEQTIRLAVKRGSGGTAQYYRMQLLQIQAALNRLQRQAPELARASVTHAYLSAASAVDASTLAPASAFAGINEPAINRLAASLAAPLQKISQTVGRQTADAFRQAGVLQSGVGIASGRTRRDTSRAIADQLSRQGITGFVDRAGRRWSMSSYASMAARTTTREAVTAGTVDRMQGVGLDLITISEHDGSCEICAEYEGQTYSLSGDTSGYDVADDLPPYHPNCEHVATPAEADFQAFIGALNGEDAETLPEPSPLLQRFPNSLQLQKLFTETPAANLRGLQTLTPEQLTQVRDEVQRRTQISLKKRGFEEEITLYRNTKRAGHAPGIVELRTSPTTNALGTWDTPVIVKRADVLIDPTVNTPRETESNSLFVHASNVQRPTAPERPPITAEPGTIEHAVQSFDPAGAAPRDVVALGDRIMSEVERRLGPVIERDRNRLQKKVATLEEQKREVFRTTRIEPFWDDPAYKKFSDKVYAAQRELRDSRAREAQLRARTLRKVLEEIRPMGGDLNVSQPFKGSEKLIKNASPYLPGKWIERSNLNGQIIPKLSEGEERAYHVLTHNIDVTNSLINISAKEDPSTVLHEISHRMEYLIPELQRLEDEYLQERARAGNGNLALEKLRKLTGNQAYGDQEIAYEGTGMTHAYMAKSYKRKSIFVDQQGTATQIGAYQQGDGEIFTMGQEGVWYDRYSLYRNDPEYYRFIVGLLAGLG